jgi:putative component of membrane protein insertase Oxa1/YidC/SpoIIIJ protein YidD
MKVTNCCIAILFFVPFLLSAQEYVDGNLVSSLRYDRDNSANSVINLYQKHLSKLKNGTCAMYPSCSNYGLMVFNDKPFFEAMSLMSDRLMRCSHDRSFYNTTYEYGFRSLVDYPSYKKMPSFLKRTPDIYTDIVKSSKDSALLFVNHLINNQEYSSALLEIQRLEFFGGLNPSLSSNKLLCYRALDMCEKGIYEYEVLLPEQVAKEGAVMLQAARLYYSTGNFERVISVLDKGLEDSAYLYSQEAVYALKAVSYARMAEYDSSIKEFKNASCLKENDRDASIRTVEKLKELRYKDPNIARLLSVFPGAGYLYAGHKGTALTSFLVNGLLMYATYTCLEKENYGLAGVLGFVSLSFYVGNITGAGRSAIRRNDSHREKLLRDLERTNYMFNN